MENFIINNSENVNLIREEDQDGWRWYLNRVTKERYLGITGVLGIAVDQKLKNYFVKNSANSQAKKLTTTGDIGSRLHEAIEANLKGETHTLSEDIQKPFENWLILKEKHKIKATLTEKMVQSDLFGVGGTLDIVGEFEGQKCVMDIKSGYYGVKASWQMAVYRCAAIEMGLIDKTYGLVGLSVPRDGSTPKPFKVQHVDWVTERFLCTLEVFKGLYFYKLKELGWGWLHSYSPAVFRENKERFL